jgi:hypothetical protein
MCLNNFRISIYISWEVNSSSFLNVAKHVKLLNNVVDKRDY